MSIFKAVVPLCPSCRAPVEADWSASVNADRRPDLRAAILDGSFQQVTCGACGSSFRLPPHLTLLNLERDQWIAARPAEDLEDWRAAEAEAREIYDDSFGERAPREAQYLTVGLQPRLVFGWAALREKLLCVDLDLDDTTLELLKMATMRAVDDAPLADETELRLTGGDDETLHFAWLVARTGRVLDTLSVPRELFDQIEAEPEIWDPVRARFDGALLVDLRRFLVGEQEAVGLNRQPEQPADKV
jgi:CpXC protein